MEDLFELEKLIEQGLQVNFRDYSAVESWLDRAHMALTAFSEERHRFELACFSDLASPGEKVEKGLEILNVAADRLTYPHPEPLCNVNCE